MAEDAASVETEPASETPLLRLLNIMARLRDPERGCPWDLKQNFKTIAPYTIEEAYEVADAIERADMDDLKDELGDLLLQVVYHARMAEEQGSFDFMEVAEAIGDKMVRRHPHVFGDAARDGESVSVRWEEIKKAERDAKRCRHGAAASPSLFEGVPAGFPALLKSAKLQRRAARIGFDWPSLRPLLEKVEEEWAELRAEIDASGEEAEQRRFEEFGDLMFVLVNLGLHLGIDGEAALRAANQKFIGRLSAMEKAASAKGVPLESLTIEEMEELWQAAKRTPR